MADFRGITPPYQGGEIKMDFEKTKGKKTHMTFTEYSKNGVGKVISRHEIKEKSIWQSAGEWFQSLFSKNKSTEEKPHTWIDLTLRYADGRKKNFSIKTEKSQYDATMAMLNTYRKQELDKKQAKTEKEIPLTSRTETPTVVPQEFPPPQEEADDLEKMLNEPGNFARGWENPKSPAQSSVTASKNLPKENIDVKEEKVKITSDKKESEKLSPTETSKDYLARIKKQQKAGVKEELHELFDEDLLDEDFDEEPEVPKKSKYAPVAETELKPLDLENFDEELIQSLIKNDGMSREEAKKFLGL